MFWVLIGSASARRFQYIVGTHWKRLREALPMSTHNICFHGEIREKNAQLLKSALSRGMAWTYIFHTGVLSM